MSEFRAGNIDVLVATTVIEVGVDVPNATVMLIEHAERFGLAQLHQLRGRVGRGAHRSHCVMVSAGFTDSSRDRLGAMLKSPDGFVIAEEDLRIRGPGEFFGTRQSGIPDLALGNVIRDAKIIDAARKEAFEIIDKDPRLEAAGHGILNKTVKKKWREKLNIASVG
jgi:ATP-dependent DNA helicase RecG